MLYREFKRTGTKISEISLGAEHLEKAPYDVVKKIIDVSMDHGVNYTDLFMGSPDIRDYFGKALKGRRHDMMLAGHLGATWKDEQYHRTRNMKMVKDFYFDLLKRLESDYIDMLMLHYIDEMDDLKVCLEDGMLEFAVRQKEKGAARMLGIATHVPGVANAALDTGLFDGIMFSINPLFDVMPPKHGIVELFDDKDSVKGNVTMANERHDLYARCQREDVGIIVMKTYAGGKLLADDAPIKMTMNQMISYALNQPSVVTAALGCKTADEFLESLKYMDADDDEKDFAEALQSSLSWSGEPTCVYCNHCLPCPEHIDIAEAMRVIDAGGNPPDNCTSCHACEKRCPFGVKVADIFTK